MVRLEYIVLTDDNIDEVVETTGRTKDLLQALLAEAASYGHHVILWHELSRWFSVRIDKEFVHDGLLDEVMRQILRRPH